VSGIGPRCRCGSPATFDNDARCELCYLAARRPVAASDAKDWTPDGPNCRQCGRHDYALHIGNIAEGLGPITALCKTTGCPLGPARVVDMSRVRQIVGSREPPHCHKVPGRWDLDGVKVVACAECVAWIELRALLGLPPLQGDEHDRWMFQTPAYAVSRADPEFMARRRAFRGES
jgi:hypothetical protein